MGLQMAIQRANAFFPESTDVSQDSEGNFFLFGKWPDDLEPIATISTPVIDFRIVSNSKGEIFELHEVTRTKSSKTSNEFINNRSLSLLLNVWTDEQIEKSSPKLFPDLPLSLWKKEIKPS